MGSKRFIAIAVVVASVGGVLFAVFSQFVSPLPVSMSLFTALNAGLLAASADSYRQLVRERARGNGRQGTGFQVGAVATINASALLGSRSAMILDAELYLAVALLILTTGYVGFYFGMLANEEHRRRSSPKSDTLQQSNPSAGTVVAGPDDDHGG